MIGDDTIVRKNGFLRRFWAKKTTDRRCGNGLVTLALQDSPLLEACSSSGIAVYLARRCANFSSLERSDSGIFYNHLEVNNLKKEDNNDS